MRQTIIVLLVLLMHNVVSAQQQSKNPTFSPHAHNFDSVFRSHIGKTYVPFDITTLNGRHISNQSCKGKIVILNFWFEDCGGCRGEIKQLNTLYDSLKNDPDIEFVAITFDKKETIPAFVSTFKLHYPIATISSQAEAYRMNYYLGFPTNVILDKSGKVALVKMGISARSNMLSMSVQQVYDEIATLRSN